jgi:hypothetical protein
MSFSVTLNPVSGRVHEFSDLPRKTVKNGHSLGDAGIPTTCRYWQRTASKERRIPQKECRSTKRHSSAYTRCHLTCLIFTRCLKTWVLFSLCGIIKCNMTSYNVLSVTVIIVSQLLFMEICILFNNINISVYCNILYSRNAGWGCLRIRCWGEYLDLRGTRWQGNGGSCKTRSWMICTPYPLLCGW